MTLVEVTMQEGLFKVSSTARGVLFALAIALLVTACGSRVEVKKDVKREELPLWRVLQHRTPGLGRVLYEDRWFSYKVDLVYFTGGQVNAMIASCPVAEAKFTVMDRTHGDVIRTETVTQGRCNACHPY